MKTPMEVINSDNSEQINKMKEQVVEVCDILFKNFERTIFNIDNKNSDKTFVSFIDDLPQYIEYEYDNIEFIELIKNHFRNMIGEWSNFVDINFNRVEDYVRAGGFWYCEIICKFDIKNNCYIEVERN